MLESNQSTTVSGLIAVKQTKVPEMVGRFRVPSPQASDKCAETETLYTDPLVSSQQPER